MRYRLSTLFYLVAIVALAIGWIVDRTKFSDHLAEELDREGAVTSAMTRALCANMIYSQLEDLDEKDFLRKRESELLQIVIFLFLNENSVSDDKRFILRRHASVSLSLLGVSDPQDFAERAAKCGYADWCEEGFVDGKPQLTSRFTEFLIRALEYDLSEGAAQNQIHETRIETQGNRTLKGDRDIFSLTARCQASIFMRQSSPDARTRKRGQGQIRTFASRPRA